MIVPASQVASRVVAHFMEFLTAGVIATAERNRLTLRFLSHVELIEMLIVIESGETEIVSRSSVFRCSSERGWSEAESKVTCTKVLAVQDETIAAAAAAIVLCVSRVRANGGQHD